MSHPSTRLVSSTVLASFSRSCFSPRITSIPSRFASTSTPPPPSSTPPPPPTSSPPPPPPPSDPTPPAPRVRIPATTNKSGLFGGGAGGATKVLSPAEARNKHNAGLFNLRSAGIFLAAGTGLYFYFETEKAKMDEIKRKRAAQKSVKTGKPLIGGPFSLLDQDGNTFTEADLLGKWTLMYFGFTNCPDICPEELDKMSDVVDILDAKHGPIARPVFVSVDPARDDIPQVKAYVGEFHSRTIGLTGPYDAIKHMCKVYRVYFSTPPKAKAEDDYLVDHSIYFYLLDPDGAFVEAFGKDVTAEVVAEKVEGFLEEWKEAAKLAKRLGEY